MEVITMRRLKFLRKPKPDKEKEGKVVSSEGLRGKDRKLHETLVRFGWAKPPSEIISLEEASESLRRYEEEAREHKQAGQTQEATRCWHQVAASCLILAPRALFKGDQKLLEECLKKYETLKGERLLRKEDVGRAIELIQQNRSPGTG
jgi:hypothetical protein